MTRRVKSVKLTPHWYPILHLDGSPVRTNLVTGLS
jgi:hypothetical protein